ncbi:MULTISPECIES: serine kinase/phosphatase [unclassified Pseudomonas]|uniref:serine kinase/phosphatase n=1 Tax=unclassified Pseudomonas TaxID=196821 RepID=UPI000A1FFBE9|nr:MULTISPECIES: serine kinase/phosphatase [unclassified Pseudomonas]
MNDSRRPFDAAQPAPIDDTQDRMGSVHELDFDDEQPDAKIGDELPPREREQLMPRQRVREAGMTGASVGDHQPTDDDLSPETLIREDGARDAHEAGRDDPADWDLSIVDSRDIGAGDGPDEAELARRDPLDRKR